MNKNPRRVAVLSAMYACRHEGRLYFHLSFGRVIERLAERVDKLILCIPVHDAPPDRSRDCELRATNYELVAQPFYTSSLGALRYPWSILRAYNRALKRAGSVFVRAMLPYVGIFYPLARLRGCRTCHWIVSNPVALLRTHRRAGRVMDALSLLYAFQDRFFTKLGRRLTAGSLICNGQELGEVYQSDRTYVTVSSTITEDEIDERQDTCTGEVVRILFVGFVRPEKGVEYLIEAVGRLKTVRRWELCIVGPTDRYVEYKRRLDSLAQELGIADRIRWVGYASYGPEMFGHLRSADLFVLPTLSEGTPRVLIEARANSLPVVASNVGGIPSSVTHEKDGLLVAPKDAEGIARAIDRIIEDGQLRRTLICNGLATVRKYTVDRFVDLVAETLQMEAGNEILAEPNC